MNEKTVRLPPHVQALNIQREFDDQEQSKPGGFVLAYQSCGIGLDELL
jgi:hypothetical protein